MTATTVISIIDVTYSSVNKENELAPLFLHEVHVGTIMYLATPLCTYTAGLRGNHLLRHSNSWTLTVTHEPHFSKFPVVTARFCLY